MLIVRVEQTNYKQTVPSLTQKSLSQAKGCRKLSLSDLLACKDKSLACVFFYI